MEIEDCFFDTSEYEMTDKKLGEGTFGKVIVVKSQVNEKLYAAKIIKINGVFTSREQLLFLRESLILNKLNHPSIVDFIGINFHSIEDTMNLSPTILTEYYQNGSLKDLIDKEKKKNDTDSIWTPTKKYICLLGISDAMRYLHKVGIIHRDLKPHNILIDDNHYPKVSDFGLSRCFSNSLTNSMQISMTLNVGSPLYMAPELFEDDEHYGPAVDVYAFAILAYEIVTGKEPFSKDGKSVKMMEIFKQVTNGGRPEFEDGFQSNIKELIEKCWSQDPKERPSFDEIFETLSTDFSYSIGTINEDEIKNFLKILEERKSNQPNSKKDEGKSPQIDVDELNKQLASKDKQIEKLKFDVWNCQQQISSKDEQIKKLQFENECLKNKNVRKCLHIKICEAQKIMVSPLFKKPSTYVTLHLKNYPKKVFSTHTMSNRSNPVWNEEFNLITNGENDALIINMYNEDQKGDEKIIDELEFPVKEWKIDSDVDKKEIDLKKKKKKIGSLIFDVQAFLPIDEYSKEFGYRRSNNKIQCVIADGSTFVIKLVMLCGRPDVGQTSLLNRFVKGTYNENVHRTVGNDFESRIIDVDDIKLRLQIWDISGCERIRSICFSYFKNSNGFILNYDVTDELSFKETNFWINELKKQDIDLNIPVVLVGNKIDSKNRIISYEEGEKLASENNMKYFETSAKENIGVDDVFQLFVNKYIQYIKNEEY